MKRPQTRYNTIMLIDDSEIDNFINHKMVEGCSFSDKIYIHTSSKSALEFLKNLERLEVVPPKMIPEVIFLDINMPIMDGFQFAEAFEGLSEKIKGKTKIVILTTSSNPSDFATSKKYKRISHYINKPLTQAALAKI